MGMPTPQGGSYDGQDMNGTGQTAQFQMYSSVTTGPSLDRVLSVQHMASAGSLTVVHELHSCMLISVQMLCTASVV